MKLITELTEKVEHIIEEGTSGEKNLYIQGPFMMYDEPNRNGRIYRKNVMEKALNSYIKEKVSKNAAAGELNHPSGPNINLDRVSHKIVSLEMKNDGCVWGKALILETPTGNIVRGLLKGGLAIGVSSRGLGSLKEGKGGIMEVQEDFQLVTAADIVSDPSAYKAYVEGIMENVDYYFDATKGTWAERIVERHHQEMRRMNTRELQEKKAQYFQELLENLVNR